MMLPVVVSIICAVTCRSGLSLETTTRRFSLVPMSMEKPSPGATDIGSEVVCDTRAYLEVPLLEVTD
jgi:hypothetical protein